MSGTNRAKPKDAFTRRLDGIFEKADREIAILFSALKAEAAGKGNLNSSGFGVRVVQEFETFLGGTVNEALKAFDHATNSPLARRRERAAQIRAKIALTLDKAVMLTQPKTNAFRDPWPSVIRREAPGLERRLVALVDQHLTGLAGTGILRPFEPWWKRDWRARVLIGATCLVVGALVQTAIAQVFKSPQGVQPACHRARY